MYQIKISNRFSNQVSLTATTITERDSSFTANDSNLNSYKTFSIPLNLDFTPIDYSEQINDIIVQGRENSINSVIDYEKAKYNYTDVNGIPINFRFYNKNTSGFTISYTPIGFSTLNDFKSNGFKKSYFRLYFYDSLDTNTRNLLFYEDINVYDPQTVQNVLFTPPVIVLKRLYWYRMDDFFMESTQNRTVYMTARFFNSKTGKIHNFVNTPISINTPPTIELFSSNINWVASPIRIINPKNNGGYFNFKQINQTPLNGSNTSLSITLTEDIKI